MGEYAPVTTDWREPLLAGASVLDVRLARRDPARWPGYHPQPSVRAYRLAGSPDAPGPVAVVWDFAVQGGSFGEDDATVLVAAVRHAIREQVPVLTLVRTGGTRLQEGVAGLVGIPRSRLALLSLAEAGLPHLSVADAPTTGGVWISVVAAADVRVAVAGAVVGFAGPRVVEAYTGALPGPDSHTAESAYAAGLVDAVLPPEQVVGWLRATLATLAPSTAGALAAPVVRVPSVVGGWEQVLRCRARTEGGRELLTKLLTDRVPLRARGGDPSVAACVGRLSGRPVVGVAVAAELSGRPTPDGFRLAARAYRLAGRWGLPALTLVDTPGAEPGPAAERDGIAPAIGAALDALLSCPSPTLTVVHGEGGSGGALAVAVADKVLVTDEAYFAAIGPEGAQAALRMSREDCADRMRIVPADLLSLGFADALVTPADLAAQLATLVSVPDDVRLDLRLSRWSGPILGTL